MTSRVFRIALTGGIASGKSTVADMFGELGAVLIDTDLIARDVVLPGTAGLQDIVDSFGADILDADGMLDRPAMRRLVFADDSRRRQLEAILHPKIRQEAERQMQTRGGPYQIVIVPLLFESPLKSLVDRIVVVDCSEQIQLERLLARDIGTKDQARRMLAAQAGRQERLALADDVVANDADLAETLRQVTALHTLYMSLAAAT